MIRGPQERRRAASTPESAARVTRILLGLLTAYLAIAVFLLVVAQFAQGSWAVLLPQQREPAEWAGRFHGAALLVAALAALGIRRRPRLPAWCPKLVVAIVALLGLASVDTIVGIVFPPPRAALRGTVFELHAARGWTSRRNIVAPLAGTVVRTDGRGLRIPEEGPPEDPAGKRKILFVGDSVTMGYYHPARAVFGWQTVKTLKERHENLELISLNGGVCGYDLRQEHHWLVNEGLELDPDLVVLQICLNDVNKQYDPDAGITPNRHAEFGDVARPSSFSGLGRAASVLWMRLRFGKDLQAAAAEIEHFAVRELLSEHPPPHVERAWRNVAQQLQRIVASCRRAGKPLVIVCFPTRSQVVKPDASTSPQRRLADIADRLHTPFLDLLDAYRGHAGGRPEAADALFVEEIHPTVLGHRVAGEALASFLDESGVLMEALAPDGL